MAAEIRRHGFAIAEGQQLFAEQHDDGHAADDQRNADEGELEEAEAGEPGILCGFRYQHVDR